MAAVRTFFLPHYPTYPIHICMFQDVSNAAYLRSQLLEANPDFDYAFLDAAMILSASHLLSASFLALHAHLTHRSKTRTPHSELVFRLHPNPNIGEAYKRFGISDSSSTLIAVKFGKLSKREDGKGDMSGEDVGKFLGEVVQGKCVDVGEQGEEVERFRDLGRIGKVYKVGAPGNKNGNGNGNGKKRAREDADGEGDGDTEPVDKVLEMEMVILGMMTIKGS
ncbi:kinase binding protein CGI-121-domain-containing protein [Clohesyomyces aquaticus]|uniref:EKC/KEOPS complex subunit CGI121 n=1 Tax=Clohesyomyces aquaticus TaxID=1231657 RepID=A0A1Y1ZEG7_9PLEO|nr:kinase binding protein CGI-121-domain-containing protein [Clohesyomyces aquaticus]